ncbi:MAG: nucleotidyltransferase family protein [Pontixanthobacter sp.]
MKGSSPIAEHAEGEIAIAVLAAGKGSRFGGGKLDAALRGKPLGRWITQSAEQAGFSRRIVIVGQSAPNFIQNLSDWDVVENPDAEEGMGTSIAAAAKAAQGCTRLVIALADMPRVSAGHLRNIASQSAIVFTAYPDGHAGVPAAFPTRCLPRLAKLSGTKGAASIGWEEGIQLFPPPDYGELDDVDTLEALERLRIKP